MRGFFPVLMSRAIGQARREGTAMPVFLLQRDMNTLLDDFSHSFGAQFDTADFVHRLDMHESEKEILIKAELPGMDEKDIEVSLRGDVLVISGEKKEEKETTNFEPHRTEFRYGSFRREIALPQELALDKADAVFSKGVLRITLPKSPAQEKTKKIEIKSK